MLLLLWIPVLLVIIVISTPGVAARSAKSSLKTLNSLADPATCLKLCVIEDPDQVTRRVTYLQPSLLPSMILLYLSMWWRQLEPRNLAAGLTAPIRHRHGKQQASFLAFQVEVYILIPLEPITATNQLKARPPNMAPRHATFWLRTPATQNRQHRGCRE